jgi:hypothetical protein
MDASRQISRQSSATGIREETQERGPFQQSEGFRFSKPGGSATGGESDETGLATATGSGTRKLSSDRGVLNQRRP